MAQVVIFPALGEVVWPQARSFLEAGSRPTPQVFVFPARAEVSSAQEFPLPAAPKGGARQAGANQPLVMRVLRWDDGTRFDDPNAYWGDPSYVLEPGDPGYVGPAPPPAAPLPLKKGKRIMSSNATPNNLKVLRSLAHDLADGLHHIEVTINMKQNKEADLRADLLPLEGDPAATPGTAAFKGSMLVYDESQSITAAAEAAVNALSKGPVYDFLLAASDLLRGVLSRRWSSAWIPTGFPGSSTSVPVAQDQRFALLLSLKNYFTANPTYERNQPPHPEVTAAKAAALHAQVSDARDLANLKAGQQEAAKNTRDAHKQVLYKRVMGTIAELRQVLAVDSPHWETLGLNIPANPTPPEAVAAVTLTAAGTGRILAEWARPKRAERYRVLRQIVGTDPDFVEADVVEALEVTLKQLPPGAVVKVKIVATNEGGDAAASPVAQITVP